MKRLLCLPLLLLSGLTAFGQVLTIGPVIRRPANLNTYNLSINANTKLLELTPKTGSPFLVRIHPNQVFRFAPILDSLRALSKPASYRPDYNGGIDNLPAYYPARLSTSPEIASAINNRPTFAQLGELLAAQNDTSFSPAQIQLKLQTKADSNLTRLRLLSKPTAASLAQIRAWNEPLPAAFSIADAGQSGMILPDLSDNTTPDDSVMTFVVNGIRYKRPYDARISVEKWGVVFGEAQADATRTANTRAFTRAANSGYNLFIPRPFEVNDKVRVVNKSVDWVSATDAFIRQTVDDSLIVIDNRAGQHLVSLDNMYFQADGNFNKSVAVTILNYPTMPPNDPILSQPFVHANRLYFRGADAFVVRDRVKGFKKYLVIDAPNRATLTNINIQGNGGALAGGTVGIELTSSRPAIEPIADGVHIYDVSTGFRATSTGPIGIEGGRLINSTMAGVSDGVVVSSTAYQTPYWNISGNHIAAYRFNVNLSGLAQGFVLNNVLYNSGNNLFNDYAAFVRINESSDYYIQNNVTVYTGTNQLNDPYGIIGAGTGTNTNVRLKILDNTIRLKVGSDKPAIWLQNPTIDSDIHGNTREGGNKTVLEQTPSLNTGTFPYNNFPLDGGTYSTAGWTTGTYNQIVPPGIFKPGRAYRITLTYVKPGTDEITQSYLIVGSRSYPGVGAQPVLAGNVSSYSGTGKLLNTRQKAPAAADQTYGLESAISHTELANGTFTVSINPQP